MKSPYPLLFMFVFVVVVVVGPSLQTYSYRCVMDMLDGCGTTSFSFVGCCWFWTNR